MKTKNLSCTFALIPSLAVALCTGCGSFPKESDAKTTAAFQQPIDRAQKTAVDALVATGFDIKKQEPAHVEGSRPRKVGFAVGSGGEKAGIWLIAQAPDRTEVKVKTNKSFAGRVGQKDWDSDIIAEMTKSLGK